MKRLLEFSLICKQDFYNLVERVSEDWKLLAEPCAAASNACLEELFSRHYSLCTKLRLLASQGVHAILWQLQEHHASWSLALVKHRGR